MGQSGQTLGEVFASGLNALDFAFAAQLVEHAARRGDGQAAAAERGAVVARFERIGTPPAMPFAMATMSGVTP